MLTLLKMYLLPPGIIIVALLFALVVVWYWRRRWGRRLGIAVVLVFWALSTSRVATLLMDPLETSVPIATQTQWKQAQAIVILSGGRLFGQYQLNDFDDVTPMAMQRLADGARIKRETDLPVLIAGGGGRRGTRHPPEADLMAFRFESSFGLPTRWREVQSHNTEQNALYSARILREQNIDTVILVTSAWHMPRAKRAFENEGLTVLAAPTGFTARAGFGPRSFSPDMTALSNSYWALHEYIGLLVGR
ncbi:YdcF family protein [Kushneria sp. Sum13]|uniref:YdcF family protein n=1 Tax=Kushneria sp. Sum13 TaxID=3459196 RepID=UPI0040454992